MKAILLSLVASFACAAAAEAQSIVQADPTVVGKVVGASLAVESSWPFANILILGTDSTFHFVHIVTEPPSQFPFLQPTTETRAKVVLTVALLIKGSDVWKIALGGLYQAAGFSYVFHKNSWMKYFGS